MKAALLKDHMVHFRRQLLKIRYINIWFLIHFKRGKYSEAIKKLQDEICIFLNMQTIPEIEKGQLAWLQLKLYESGICLSHHETWHSSLTEEGCHVPGTLDFALAFFQEAFQ